MNTQALMNKTESWLQQEMRAQQHLLELLTKQEEAISAGSGEGIHESGEKIQHHLRTGPAREQLRLELMQRFGKAWGVATDTLTLRSIAERAAVEGVPTERLSRLREELREVGAQVLRKGRRIAVMARYHQGVLGEILGLLLGDEATEKWSRSGATGESGVLVNQEA